MSTYPVLDYANPPRTAGTLKFALAAAAAGVSFLNLNLTVCMCGYQDLYSAPGNLIGTGLAVWAFCITSRSFMARGMSAIAVIFCVIILALNVHNVLWSGHDPLFRN